MGSGLVGSTSRDLSAAVKSALDELVKVPWVGQVYRTPPFELLSCKRIEAAYW